jgi:Ca2+-binding RTX toxin-like protein
MSSARRLSLGIGAVALALLALPALAGASTVSSAGGTIKVVDPQNLPLNTQIQLAAGGNSIGVSEAPNPVVAGPGCVQQGANARCPIAGVARIVVDARGGDDQVQINLNVPANLRGAINGGTGDDVLEGGNTRDLIVGGPNGDQMVGNGNFDTASYQGVPRRVRARIGGPGFVSGSVLDGPAGSRDQIVGDIEALIGGRRANNLQGNGLANKLVGGPRTDKLRGLAGNDRVLGRKGRDYVVGGDNDDRLVGGRGRDKIGGGNGIDRLNSKDGLAEVFVNCGPPAQPEFVKFDQGLDFPTNC